MGIPLRRKKGLSPMANEPNENEAEATSAPSLGSISVQKRGRGRPRKSLADHPVFASMQRKRGRPRQTSPWDSTDRAFLGLYGVNLEKPEASKPQFGSGFRPVLTVGGEMTATAPTPTNIAAHLGYMDWMDAIIKKLTQVNLPSDQFQQLVRMCRKGSRELLEVRLQKVRRALLALAQPLYFYCVSQVTVETDLVTGTPLLTEGERVLCLLPKTPQVAKHYGFAENEIALLAPQVMWLVTTLLPSRHVITTPAQLSEAVDGWTNYLPPAVTNHLQEQVREAYPQLIAPQMAQFLLLPSGA